MERVESCHSIWLFDTERRRFRRLPKGSPFQELSLESDWEPYYGLEISVESGAFAVALNASRTRFLRSWRHTERCEHCMTPADVTAELTIAPVADGRPPA